MAMGLVGYGGNDTQVLRAHIANLRRKIEPDGGAAGTGIYVPILGSATGLPDRSEPISRGDAHNKPTSCPVPAPVIEHTPPWMSPERDPTFEDGPAVTRRGRRMR